jgi:small GTP-binding protein
VIQHKVCMVGAFAVGKTCLVQRFVYSIYPDRYLTTVGVKIERKVLQRSGTPTTLLLWDLAGEDEFHTLRMSYLRGSSGYLLVADGTRRATLDTAVSLQRNAEEVLGPVPFILVVNKADLRASWEIDRDRLTALEGRGWQVLEASAKSGAGVEEAFAALAARMPAAAS